MLIVVLYIDVVETILHAQSRDALSQLLTQCLSLFYHSLPREDTTPNSAMHTRTSYLPLVLAIVVLFLVAQELQTPHHPSSELLRATLKQYSDEGKTRIDLYAKLLESRLDQSLQRMFEDLDKNGDACIDRTEFHGRALNALATVRGIDLPSLALPALPDVETSVGWVQRVVWLQFLCLVALFIIENIRVVVFDPPFSIHTGPVDWGAKPLRASIQEAMHYDTPLTRYEKLKQFLFIVTGVLFLRIALTVVFFTIGVLFVNLSVLGGRSRTANPVWFQLCTIGVKVFGYLALASLGFYCIRVAGQRAPRTETKLLVGNHICMIEVVALYLLANIPSFVSRVENLSIPLFRGLATASDAVVVDRDAASSRTKTLEAIKKRSRDPQATQLLIFPEGTCSNQLTLFQFKKGAFEPGVPVQLVCFHYPYKHFNPAWTGRACGGNDAWDLLLRMWSQFVNRLEVRFLPVYTPTAEECSDPIAFAKHCQEIIASVVRANPSEASFANYVEASKRFNKHSVVNAADSNENTPRSNKKDE